MSKIIILEDLNFIWDAESIDTVLKLWKDGVSLEEISIALNRRTEEIFLLLMHLSLKGKIKKRKNYIWGTKRKEK